MAEKKVVVHYGGGAFKLLFVLSVVLYILKVGEIGKFATMSWWLVVLPVGLIPGLFVALFSGIVLVWLVLHAVVRTLGWREDKKRAKIVAAREAKNDAARKARMTRPHLPGGRR